MSNVQFDNETEGIDWNNAGRRRRGGDFNLTRWIMNHSGGLVKTEDQANILLAVLSLVILAFSLSSIVWNFRSPSPPRGDIERHEYFRERL